MLSGVLSHLTMGIRIYICVADGHVDLDAALDSYMKHTYDTL